MMGPSHAMSGAAVWMIAAPAVSAMAPAPLTPAQILVGAAMCAGSALLPDIDQPSSTIARSFGPVTWVLSKGVNAASAGIYNLTKGTKEQFRSDGHRTVTHTLLGALAAGAGVSALCGFGGLWATLGLLFFLLGLAVRGLMHEWVKKQGWIITTVVAAAAAFAASQALPSGQDNYWWLGATVVFGMLVHDLGDGITAEGIPFTAPLPRNGKSWWEWTLPSFLRIRAGGLVENALLLPMFTAVTVLGVVAYFMGGWPVLLDQFAALK